MLKQLTRKKDIGVHNALGIKHQFTNHSLEQNCDKPFASFRPDSKIIRF